MSMSANCFAVARTVGMQCDPQVVERFVQDGIIPICGFFNDAGEDSYFRICGDPSPPRGYINMVDVEDYCGEYKDALLQALAFLRTGLGPAKKALARTHAPVDAIAG